MKSLTGFMRYQHVCAQHVLTVGFDTGQACEGWWCLKLGSLFRQWTQTLSLDCHHRLSSLLEPPDHPRSEPLPHKPPEDEPSPADELTRRWSLYYDEPFIIETDWTLFCIKNLWIGSGKIHLLNRSPPALPASASAKPPLAIYISRSPETRPPGAGWLGGPCRPEA